MSNTNQPRKTYEATVIKAGLEHAGKKRAVGDKIEVDAPTAIFLAHEKRAYIELPSGLKTAAAAAAKAADAPTG